MYVLLYVLFSFNYYCITENLLFYTVSGNPVIFTPTRKLMKEGEVDRVKLKRNGEVDIKPYYCHLFNDAFIYSSRNRVTGGYKLQVAIDLKGASITSEQVGNVQVFSLVNPKETLEDPPKLRFSKASEAWLTQIQAQIDALKVRQKDKRGSTLITKNQAGIPGVDCSQLGPRAALIHNFLLSEMQFADVSNAINITAIQPLIDASRGAVLSAVRINTTAGGGGGSDAVPEYRDNHSDALFNSNVSSVSKSQALVIKEALQEPDVKIFLRAAEGIALACRDFAGALEALCHACGWSESTSVGSFFNSVSALALYNQFKAYADGQQAMLRVLQTPPFAQFYRDAETFLSAFPGSFADKIELPRKRVKHYMSFLVNLRSCTVMTDPDHEPIQTSISALTFVSNEIEELIRVKQNFEKLLSIQNCFISPNFLSVDPVLAKLASMDRTFLKEGDLKKVCRKKNKVFRFWLFNDVLLYGAALGAGKFTFNRSLDLTTCSVKVHNSAEIKNAFEIFGAEKSFVVIANSTSSQTDWLHAIKDAKAKHMGTTVEALDSAPAASAPLWVPDSNDQGCSVCKRVSCPLLYFVVLCLNLEADGIFICCSSFLCRNSHCGIAAITAANAERWCAATTCRRRCCSRTSTRPTCRRCATTASWARSPPEPPPPPLLATPPGVPLPPPRVPPRTTSRPPR
jgi:hypothetical protein